MNLSCRYCGIVPPLAWTPEQEEVRSAPVMTCLWPGLARLWLRGETFGLTVAVLFAVMLNFALVSSFVWTEWLTAATLRMIWGALAFSWIIAAWISYRRLPQLVSPDSELADEDLFQQAQTEYLRGHWVETQSILERIVRNFPNDVDARFMLATMQRHTGNLEDARSQLKAFDRLPGSQKWCLEISQEHARLSQLDQAAKDQTEDQTTDEQTTDEETQDDSAEPGPFDFARAA